MKMNKGHKITHASLFSGFGAAELAAEWIGWRNMFWCEIDPFPRKVMQYWFPNQIGYEDITKTDFTRWLGRIDVLTGGFPCQPFSLAGRRKGADDDRYLWPEMLRAIREIRPSWVIGENVAGILTMVQSGRDIEVEHQASIFEEADKETLLEQEYVIETICCDLEREGYSVQPFVIPACAVGAPHRRDRIWIVARRTEGNNNETQTIANSDSSGFQAEGTEQQTAGIAGIGRQWTSSDTSCYGDSGGSLSVREKNRRQNDELRPEPFEHGGLQTMAAPDTKGTGIKGECKHRQREEKSYGRNIEDDSYTTADRWREFPTQPPVCRGNDGLPFDVERLTLPFAKWRAGAVKGYGNAIVPQVMYEIFRAIEHSRINEQRTT